MVVVGSEKLPEFNDVVAMTNQKLACKSSLKDQNGVHYEILKIFPNHVLTESEFGYKRCFTYPEVVWNLK